MYFLLGICLVFALLLAVNVSASLAATIIWRIAGNFALKLSARKRAQIIFFLRVFPFAAAFIFVFAFLVPSYFLFEPAESGETVGIKLISIASLSAVGTIAAFYRVFGTWWRTKRLIKEWLRRSEPISNGDSKVPVYRLTHPFPVVAVIGFYRPRIFIAAQIFDLLDKDELAAAIAHEHGHLATRDNLKRWLLRVCRDLLVFPIGKTLDRIWAETAEIAADEYVAATDGKRAALSLAAALIKIARNVPLGANPAMPLGAFLIEEQSAKVAGRVRRLVQMTEYENNFQPRNWHLAYSLRLCFGLVTLMILWLVLNESFLFRIHGILENVVDILQ